MAQPFSNLQGPTEPREMLPSPAKFLPKTLAERRGFVTGSGPGGCVEPAIRGA